MWASQKIEQWLVPSLNKHCGYNRTKDYWNSMSCSIDSASQSKWVFLPNHSYTGVLKTQKTAYGPKKWLFRIFFLLLHIYTSRHNFFVFIKISYLQPFREIMGDKEKALHRTTTNDDERRTTNDERTNERTNERTTWTIIKLRQDSFRILGLKRSVIWLSYTG